MVRNGARVAGSLGDSQLYEKMETASEIIKRDVRDCRPISAPARAVFALL